MLIITLNISMLLIIMLPFDINVSVSNVSADQKVLDLIPKQSRIFLEESRNEVYTES